MADLALTIGTGLSRYYQSRAERIHALLEPLADGQIWRRPFPYGNSIGNLLLHLTGNLSYYIGAQVAHTGYVRNRELEFTGEHQKSKAELLKAFDDVMVIVQDTIARQSPEDWTLSYTAKGLEDAQDRFTAFLRCAAHIDHHLGQMTYLCKEIGRQADAQK